MDALILAAGRGTRMGRIENPKCLLDIGGIAIIDYQISCFREIGFNRIFVVTGYNSEMVRRHLKDSVDFLYNPDYAQTNNLYSMWTAREMMNDDFVCVYGDLFFDKQILQKCVDDKNEICLAIERNIRDETMRVRIKDNYVIEVNKLIPKESANGNFIGMAKFDKKCISFLFKEISTLVSNDNHDSYYTSAIESMIKKGQKVNYVETNGMMWFDIDEKHELEEAKKTCQKMIETRS